MHTSSPEADTHTAIHNAQIRMLPLSGITERHGVEGLYRRFSLEVNELTLEEQYFCNRALFVAATLHSADMYKGLPYTSHLLRTAIRLKRDYDITDPEVLSAMLLHDSVEDHATELIEAASFLLPPSEQEQSVTEQAFTALSVIFSPRVATLVRNVTNTPHLQPMTQTEKNVAYAQGVAAKIALSPDTFLMKLSDFTDNAVGIYWSEQTRKVQKLARKYGPVFDVFLAQLVQYEHGGMLTPQQIAVANRQLQLGKERCGLLAA